MTRRGKSATARLSPTFQGAVGEVPAPSSAGDKSMPEPRRKHFVFVNEYINEYELRLGGGLSAGNKVDPRRLPRGRPRRRVRYRAGGGRGGVTTRTSVVFY